MDKLLLFWMATPPDPKMDYLLWIGFRQDMSGWFLGIVLVVVAIITLSYCWMSRRLKIRNPGDPFRPFTPMGLLGLAAVPGIFMWILYGIRYTKIFPDARISFMSGAPIAVWAVFLTYLMAQLLIWLPGITPPKYRYHPRWPWQIFWNRNRRS